MEAKIKHTGMKKNGPNFLFKMCNFFRSFPGVQMNRFCIRESLVQVSSPNARNLDPTKTAFSEFSFPKNAFDVSVTSSFVQKRTQITETKKRTGKTF